MKRSALLLATAVTVGFALSSCGSDTDTSNTDGKTVDRAKVPDSPFKPTELEDTVNALIEAISTTEPLELQMGIVLKGMDDYWNPVQVGASRAMHELDVSGGVVAPDSTNGEIDVVTAEQNAILKSQRKGDYSAIALAPFGEDNTEEIDAAIDADIPVVTIDSDLPKSKRNVYLGTLNGAAGKTGAETLLELLTEDSGTVVLYGNEEPAWKDGYERTMSAKRVLEDAGYDVLLRTTDWTPTGEEADIEYLSKAIEEADPPVVGMLGVFSSAYRLGIIAEDLDLDMKKVPIVGFDFDARTVEHMRSGRIRATHAQRQYYMGYMAPYVLYGIIALGKKETLGILSDNLNDDEQFNTGLDVVPAEQVDDYYDYLDSLGVGGG